MYVSKHTRPKPMTNKINRNKFSMTMLEREDEKKIVQ
jgi:hypothetical protein